MAGKRLVLLVDDNASMRALIKSGAIAAELGIAEKTVENHRQHSCGKLGLRGPQALLRFALERKAQLV